MLKVFYPGGANRVTNLDRSFFNIIKMGNKVITPKSKAFDIMHDEGATHFELYDFDGNKL